MTLYKKDLYTCIQCGKEAYGEIYSINKRNPTKDTFDELSKPILNPTRMPDFWNYHYEKDDYTSFRCPECSNYSEENL
jgi:DNA-directed RNA polymerase subunit RPC12/RpoP